MLHLTTALDPASQVPLYEQLYRSLVAEIRSGALPAGTRMPGKRSLAEELSVSVNTVDGAYQMLAAEGYLASRPRSGFYVQEYPALAGRPPEQEGDRPGAGKVQPACFPSAPGRGSKKSCSILPPICWPGAIPGGTRSCGRP